MRSLSSFGTFAVLALALAGCTGGFGDPEKGGPGSGGPGDGVFDRIPTCPEDPDCNLGGHECAVSVCPGFWDCRQLAAGQPGKRCINPGPEYPDQGGNWDCEESPGMRVCSRPGTEIPSFPGGGGGGEWNCVVESEFVKCTETGGPEYPDEPSEGPWDCRQEGEFRICETGTSGGSGDWACYDTEGVRECRQDTPRFPDDRTFSCYDSNGRTYCTAPGGYPSDGGGGIWDCEVQAEFVVCSAPSEFPGGGTTGSPGGSPGTGSPGTGSPGTGSPTGSPGTGSPGTGSPGTGSPGAPFEGGGGGSEWNCYFAGELRICTSTPGGPGTGSPTGSPGTGSPGTGSPGTGSPGTGSPGTGSPGTGSPGTGSPGAGSPGGGPGSGTPPIAYGSCPTPGKRRWCDDHIYCSWGTQTCLDIPGSETHIWGPCIEPTVNASGLVDRPATALGCRYFYFNSSACEDPASCVIPDGHSPPACSSDGSACSYCDVSSDCTGGQCLFASDGYAFCAPQSTASSCPSGYRVERASGQDVCVPADEAHLCGDL